MTTSSFLKLAGGGEVRFDFQPPPAPTGAPSLAYQLLDPAGLPVAPEVTVFTQLLGVDTASRVDSFNAAPLPGGGFVLAYEERDSSPIFGTTTEALHALVVDAHGVIHDDVFLRAGAGPSDGTPVAAPGVFGLSGDGFGLVYEKHDGALVTEHFALATPTHDFVDIALPGAPNSVSTADGVLTLGFSNGSRLLAGGEVSATLTGGAGADWLVAGSHGDVIRGGDGDDRIQGGAGFDNINGDKGGDIIDGGSGGGDFLVGGQGDDLINSHAGDDVLYGNLGDDTLNGGAGDEILRGGQDNDVLNGGAGNDWLSGDRGSDTVAGGAGADIFHSFGDAGIDVITDFNAAEGDRVLLDAGSIYTVVQAGDDVIINVGDTGEVILKSVQLSTLPTDFIFLA